MIWMSSEVMDQGGASSLFRHSSFFSNEIHYPAERQVGFWKSDSVPDRVGMEGVSLISSNKANASSLLDKHRPIGAPLVESLDFSQTYIVKDQKDKLSINRHVVGAERTSLSMTSRKIIDHSLGSHANLYTQPASLFAEGNKAELNGPQYENSLFSSSLSDIFKKKLRLSSTDVLFSQSIETVTSHFEEEVPFESLKEIEAQTIGNLLPDDDDLLSGVLDDFQHHAQPNIGDDMEDFDLFSSVGGLELEADDGLSCYGDNIGADLYRGISNDHYVGSNSPFAGKHPYGEHPSRTLFARNINSNVEDSELRVLFEQYGDIHTLYTTCKHRGFVMISYYDIRAACNAMRELQSKPLRGQKLDIHFSIPKDNPSEKDINQGTLVVFNLHSSVSNDDLRQIFGVYGEIKGICETPHKRNHKFVEFYDVRAAEDALNALNRSDIAGKRIKVEPSRPGGARQCLMQRLSLRSEFEVASGIRQQGSPPDNSPPGCYGPVPPKGIASNGLDNIIVRGLYSTISAPISSLVNTTFHGISSSLPRSLSSLVGVASVGNHSSQMGPGEHSHSLDQLKFGFKCIPTFHPHSLPEYHGEGVTNGVAYNSLCSMSTMSASMNSLPSEGIDNRHIPRVGSGGLNSHSFELNDGVFSASGSGSGLLHVNHYVLSNPYQSHPSSSMMWANSPSSFNGVHPQPPHQMHGIPGAPPHMMNTVLPLTHHHHVGSAPAVNPSLWDRRRTYAGHLPDTSFHAGSLGSMGFTGNSTIHSLELTSHNLFSHVGANCVDPSMSSPNVGMSSPQQRCHRFPGRNSMIPMPSLDAPNERVRSRRNEANSNQADNKKQYELDFDRILHREDTRTTLMIKNIPNKYNSKMLLAAIDENHRGTYDFIYLPIDFKNKCNVGYAFINLTDPMKIIPFFQSFNGKKWEKFNSEKVVSLAYARIQGKAALIAHFQNSSLMNEDKRCRPILFHSSGPNAGEPEPFPMGTNIRPRPSKTRTSSNEDNHHGSPLTSLSGEDGTDSSSGSTKSTE
eukprot:TRINITY_DN3053_c0_g1_i4.p1 TRINITY_DN3053_c0_g1~~TRINITY_DN3053_c0_g1_i4.p1  ORF type:complete len:1017 (+),score=195.61 TRINITY_DN3053_c0_g1_i4:488-3538(+)